MVIGHLLIYLLLFAGVFTFNVVNTSYVPFLVDIIFAALTVYLVVSGLILRANIQAHISNPDERPVRGTDFELLVEISNTSFLPLNGGSFRFRWKYNVTGKKMKKRYHFSCRKGDTAVVRVPVNTRHCETVSYRIRKLYIYDHLHLFVFPIRVKIQDDLIVMPQLPSTEIVDKMAFEVSDEENNLYSPNKPGDDPTEIFAIREYVPGDKIRNIHWKLTSKTNKLMVKDYALPIRDQDCIVVDLYKYKDPRHELYDTLFDGLNGLVYALTSFGFGFNACYIKNGVYTDVRVENTNDINALFVDLYETKAYPLDTQSAAELYFLGHDKIKKRVFYVTPYLDEQTKANMCMLAETGPVYYLTVPELKGAPRLPVRFTD